jgi:hypothetical protein
MRPLLSARSLFATGFFWLAAQPVANAQVLLAQTGTAKTAIGWGIVALCVGLGLLVVCRPAPDQKPKKKKKKAA